MRIKKTIRIFLLGLASTASFVSANDGAEAKYIPVQLSVDIPAVSLGGTVVPLKEVTLTAQLPGRVNFIAGIEGDGFKANALLLSLDDAELKAKSNAAYARLANAEYALKTAGIQYTREYYSPQSSSSMGGMGMPNLFDRVFTRPMEGFIGNRDRSIERTADVYVSQTRIDQARTQIFASRAEIQALAANIRDAKSLAPFDGIILKKFVETGDTVQPGQVLLTFANPDFLQIEINVPTTLSSGLTKGQVLHAELASGNSRVPVRVAQVYPMADAAQHTVKVKLNLPQGVSAPGMYAKVLFPDLNAAVSKLPVIPTSAIRFKGSLSGVYVKTVDGLPEFRLVRIGHEPKLGFTSILSGIKPGELVLVNPGN